MPNSEFRDWYEKQWLAQNGYHKRIHDLENTIPAIETLLKLYKAEQDRTATATEKLRYEMYGNGEPGYVRRTVIIEMQEIRNIITADVLREIEKTTAGQTEKWDGRKWAIRVMVFQSILSIVVGVVVALATK